MRFRNFPKSKYGAKRTEQNGYSFASGLERAVYNQLQIMQIAKLLIVKQTQVTVYLTEAKIKYIADFLIENLEENREELVEAKGFETPEWRIKLTLYKSYGTMPLQIWRGTKYRPFLDEVITPKGMMK